MATQDVHRQTLANQAQTARLAAESMRALIDRFDWSRTAIGERSAWPNALRMHVETILGSKCPMAVFWGEKLAVIYNDAWRGLIDERHPEALGQPASALIADSWERIQPLFDNVWSSGVGVQEERLFARDRDGRREERWIHFSLSPIMGEDGRIGGLFNVALDVTDRVRSEAALRESRSELERQARFLNTTLANIGDYVYVLNRKKQFVYATDKLLKLWGRSGDEYVGLNFQDLGYERQLRERLNDEIDDVFNSGKPVSGTTPYFNPSGSFGYYEYVLSPLTDESGQFEFVAGVSRDITERRRAEEAIRRSEARYRTLFNSIAEGFCVFEMIFDDDGKPQDYRWLETNPAFERHTGLVDAVGKTARQLVPDLEPHWPEIYGRVALTRKPERFEEHSPAMGRWFELDAFPVGEPEERRVALLFNDITERRRAEAALKEADQRKTEFLATLAHELRNPLAPIRSGIELIKRAGDDPVAREQACATMDRQIRQLVTLVDDLLDVSRIDRGRLELRKCRVKLSEIITSSVESLSPTIEKAQQTLTVDVPQEAVYLDADPHRLVQVLSNLLSNASKYTPEGGRIWLSVARSADQVAISIRDSGIGIPEDMLERVFEMFAQIDRPEEKGYTGLGIGLTLARSLTEMHGGRIEVDSEGEGRGSVFTVCLPVLENGTAAEVQPRVSQAVGASKRRPRVLVVDDNEEAARMLGLLLGVLGTETRTAFGGREALAVAESFLPDLVFMDIGMPEMDGFETTRRLRERDWGRSTRIVALTGWGQAADRAKTREAGFDHHLVKPADPVDLERLLAELG